MNPVLVDVCLGKDDRGASTSDHHHSRRGRPSWGINALVVFLLIEVLICSYEVDAKVVPGDTGSSQSLT